MSAISDLGFKGHCLMGAVTIGSGAVAGGIMLSSVVTGAICGVARHVIDLTAMSMGLYVDKSDAAKIASYVVGIFKGLATYAVLAWRGLALTVSPLAVFVFVVLSYGLQLAAWEVIKANKECVGKCIS